MTSLITWASQQLDNLDNSASEILPHNSSSTSKHNRQANISEVSFHKDESDGNPSLSNLSKQYSTHDHVSISISKIHPINDYSEIEQLQYLLEEKDKIIISNQKNNEAYILETEKLRKTCQDLRFQVELLDSRHSELLHTNAIQQLNVTSESCSNCSSYKAELSSIKSELENELESTRVFRQNSKQREMSIKSLSEKFQTKISENRQLTSEKNALQLRLENMSRSNRALEVQMAQITAGENTDIVLHSRRNNTINANAIDNATKKLDYIGIRLLVFLHKYPSGRLIFVLYIIILHLWVFFVLIHFIHHAPTSEPKI